MITYQTYCQIHQLHDQDRFSIGQIARALKIDPHTVAHWLKRPQYARRQPAKRASRLDSYKGQIVRLLNTHEYTSMQIMHRIQQSGYDGGYTLVKDYVRSVRPPKTKAYLTLSFAPGECAQVDWGYAGAVSVGQTRRRMSFFVMVLCHSRMMYVEFTLAETQEHFLQCHKNAFDYFGGCPQRIMIDNLRSAVVSHPAGQPALYHPRYVDFSRHYGFDIRACNVGAPNEKGRVENAVRYVRTNFLRGLDLDQYAPMNTAIHLWLEKVANVRLHAATRQRPIDLFKTERPLLRPLPLHEYDVGTNRLVTASNQFRVRFDANRYSVPAQYASRRLSLRVYPSEVLIYHERELIARHRRSYERNADILNDDHQRRLLQQRRGAREQQHLLRLLRLSPRAETFYNQLQALRINYPTHVRKIIALCEIYGNEAVGRAIEDAVDLQAFSAEYITNILEQRSRRLPEPGALHLTRREDLLEIELPEPDLSIYDPQPIETKEDNEHEQPKSE